MFSSSGSFAQSNSALQARVPFWGDIPLFQSIDSLRSIGLQIAYSSDKLTNQKIDIPKGATINDYLEYLSRRRIVDVVKDSDQIVLKPYTAKSYTLNGVISNAETGEHVIGAALSVYGTNLGTTSNGYGYFSLTLQEGDYRIIISHIGYKDYELDVNLFNNKYQDINLSVLVTELEKVEISSISDDANITENIPSVSRINLAGNDGEIPYFLGEVDVIQNALLKPGIRAIGEDASGIHVRGGGVDQNLTLLDEATIYNPNHFYGLISIFNPEAVNNVKIYKGYIPPSYGGRASSIIEVRQKEGNANRTSFSGGAGPLSARVLVEGPIHKEKSSFLVSARQSLLNLSLDDFASNSVRRNRIRFQDLNFKLNFKYSRASTYYLSGYIGNDRNLVGLNSTRNWGNRMLNFRWNYLLSPRLISSIALFVSEYNYRIESTDEPGAFAGRSKIADYSFRSSFTFIINPKNEIAAGVSTVYHRLLPGSREPLNNNDNTNFVQLENERGLESAAYLSHEVELDRVGINYGVRVSSLHKLGPGTVFEYEDDLPLSDTTIVDTLTFGNLNLMNLDWTVEPRIAVNWRVSRTSSIKAAFSRTAQYIHLISNTLAPAPTDIWKLSDRFIPPTRINHYTLGYYKNTKENMWELSAEAYYKGIDNHIQYREGADLFFNDNVERELLFSTARSYGLELYAHKKYGKIKGWISYTLSRAESKIEENDQVRFVTENHDKTHDFATSWSMQVSPRLSVSSNFVFHTGIPVTLPTDKYVLGNNLVPHFQVRNNARLPNYHRLDLSLKLDGKLYKKNGKRRKNRDYWLLSFYNVYARRNAYSYFFRESPSVPGTAQVVQYSIFGTIIPAVTYNFKF